MHKNNILWYGLIMSIMMFNMYATYKKNGNNMKLESSSFKNGESINKKYTCDDANISPALQWSNAPQNTKSFVLICYDPDAVSVAGKIWLHWIVYNIPISINALPEGAKIAQLHPAKEAKTDFGKPGYGGPCPPQGHGVHHYFFKLYALNTESIFLPPTITQDTFESDLADKILATAQIMGTYERSKK